ncbi:putative 2OG-Fe(II) oxygenase [Pseudoalteromonas 'SMAR']|uniref:putative 2OG-Fe(II) oxygenase n=1 Tax=Pseudoalteromonas 'SMAR' TaxID=3416908 RepID=UPI003AF2D5BE
MTPFFIIIMIKNAKPKICFATPILEGEFEGVEELNHQLAKRFLQFEQDKEHVNDARINTTVGNIFDSRRDILAVEGYPEIEQIRRHMNGALTSWIIETGKMSRQDLEQCMFEIESWFHITRFGGTKTVHEHGQCGWSMVYYVDEGDPPTDEYPRSGFLQVYDPRKIQTNPADLGQVNFKPMFDYGGFTFRPKTGKFVIFPGYLEHEVLTYFGTNPRIMIAMNCMIKRK